MEPVDVGSRDVEHLFPERHLGGNRLEVVELRWHGVGDIERELLRLRPIFDKLIHGSHAWHLCEKNGTKQEERGKRNCGQPGNSHGRILSLALNSERAIRLAPDRSDRKHQIRESSVSRRLLPSEYSSCRGKEHQRAIGE